MTETAPRNTAVPLRTLPPRSFLFFVALITFPLGVPAFLLGGWRYAGCWLLAGVGVWSLLECVRRTMIRFYCSDAGVERRSIYGRRNMAWNEIEAVGMQNIGSRTGPVGTTFTLHGATRALYLELDNDGAIAFSRYVREHTNVLWIDKDGGLFDLPTGGDSERVRALVAQHARRLRRMHGMVLLAKMAILVPGAEMIGTNFKNGVLTGDEWLVAVVSLVLFALFSRPNVVALWRLRR